MNEVKKWFYRKLAKGRLIRRYEYLNEVTKLLEQYVTKRILDGGSEEFLNRSRQELVTRQNEVKENERLIAFLRQIK